MSKLNDNEIAHMVYMQVKRNFMLNTPYRVARSAQDDLVDRIYEPSENDSQEPRMRDFVPSGYRSFLKRLPTPKRQPHNKFLDNEFDVTIGTSKQDQSQYDKPLVVTLKPPLRGSAGRAAKTPDRSFRSLETRSQFRRSYLLASSDNFEATKVESTRKPFKTSEIPRTAMTKSATILSPKQFILPAIEHRTGVKNSSTSTKKPHHPKWITKVEIIPRKSKTESETG